MVVQEPEAWDILKDLEKISDEYDSRCGCLLAFSNILLALQYCSMLGSTMHRASCKS